MEGHLNNPSKIHSRPQDKITSAFSKWVVDNLYLNNTTVNFKTKNTGCTSEGIGGFGLDAKS